MNRKAVKEARPPANEGDDRESSSHHDEMIGAEITLNDSEFHIFEDDTVKFIRGSSPNGQNIRQSSFKNTEK